MISDDEITACIEGVLVDRPRGPEDTEAWIKRLMPELSDIQAFALVTSAKMSVVEEDTRETAAEDAFGIGFVVGLRLGELRAKRSE